MLTAELQSFFWGAAGFGVYFLTLLLVLRLPGRVAPVLRHVGLALLIHLGMVVGAICFLAPRSYWHGAALYWCCFLLTLFAYSAVYKSVSLEILAQLARRETQSLTLPDISDGYIRPTFDRRIDILVAAGHVVEGDGRFHLTEAGRRLARRFGAVQKLFGITRSGLYNTKEGTNVEDEGTAVSVRGRAVPGARSGALRHHEQSDLAR
jgi:hypothetical protein